MTAPQSVESVEKAALQLQPDARVKLTRALVESLADLPEAEIAELWLAEAERRDLEMDAGRAIGISGEEVFRRIRARFG